MTHTPKPEQRTQGRPGERHQPEELFEADHGAARLADGESPVQRAADPRGAAKTAEGEVFRETDFYPGGLPQDP